MRDVKLVVGYIPATEETFKMAEAERAAVQAGGVDWPAVGDDETLAERLGAIQNDYATALTALGLLSKLLEAANPGDPDPDGGLVIDAFVFLDDAEADLVRRLRP